MVMYQGGVGIHSELHGLDAILENALNELLEIHVIDVEATQHLGRVAISLHLVLWKRTSWHAPMYML
ncbi:hypothetical protein ACJX0J_024147, partial [Zea mays]